MVATDRIMIAIKLWPEQRNCLVYTCNGNRVYPEREYFLYILGYTNVSAEDIDRLDMFSSNDVMVELGLERE